LDFLQCLLPSMNFRTINFVLNTCSVIERGRSQFSNFFIEE
jgi:hypothetical protein